MFTLVFKRMDVFRCKSISMTNLFPHILSPSHNPLILCWKYNFPMTPSSRLLVVRWIVGWWVGLPKIQSTYFSSTKVQALLLDLIQDGPWSLHALILSVEARVTVHPVYALDFVKLFKQRRDSAVVDRPVQARQTLANCNIPQFRTRMKGKKAL